MVDHGRSRRLGTYLSKFVSAACHMSSEGGIEAYNQGLKQNLQPNFETKKQDEPAKASHVCPLKSIPLEDFDPTKNPQHCAALIEAVGHSRYNAHGANSIVRGFLESL